MDEGKPSSAAPLAARGPVLQLQPVTNSSDGRIVEDRNPLSVKSSRGAHRNVEGGGIAWLQVAGSFLLIFNTWGFINTYGSFQTFYEQDLLQSHSSSQISWIGSIQAFLLLFLAIFVGPLLDRGHVRDTIMVGSALLVFGMMMISLCTKYWQVVLAHGFVVGTGMGTIYMPSVAILPKYFIRRRALSLGIAFTGGALGGIVYPIIFHQLQPAISFAWTTRVIACVALATLIFPVVVMRRPEGSASPPKIAPSEALQGTRFRIFLLVILLRNISLYVPFFYIQIYAIEVGQVGSHMGFYLLSIMNAGSFFGRIIPGYLADLLSPLTVTTPCSLATTILLFSWIAINPEPVPSLASIIAYCGLWGFFSAATITLDPALRAQLTPDMRNFNTRLALGLLPNAFGLLVGNPIAGSVLQRHGWTGLQSLAGVVMAASTMGYAIMAVLVRKGNRAS